MENGKKSGHQGDVQFFSVDGVNAIPKGVKKAGKTFVAKSEKTGHVHVLCGDYEMYEEASDPKRFYVVVGEKGAVMNHTHQSVLDNKSVLDAPIALPLADHKPIFFRKGVYAIGIQRRLNPFSGVFESVVD